MEGTFSVSGLMLLIMAKMKGKLDQYLEIGSKDIKPDKFDPNPRKVFTLSVSSDKDEWYGQNP